MQLVKRATEQILPEEEIDGDEVLVEAIRNVPLDSQGRRRLYGMGALLDGFLHDADPPEDGGARVRETAQTRQRRGVAETRLREEIYALRELLDARERAHEEERERLTADLRATQSRVGDIEDILRGRHGQGPPDDGIF